MTRRRSIRVYSFFIGNYFSLKLKPLQVIGLNKVAKKRDGMVGYKYPKSSVIPLLNGVQQGFTLRGLGKDIPLSRVSNAGNSSFDT
jgi:hypothetical protein